jgi:transketolase
LKAQEILEEKGISTGIINMRCLKPVDENIIISSAINSKMMVTLEDHFVTGGLYSIVAETLLKHRITADVLPIALNNQWFKPALLQDVLAYEGFTAEKIAGKIETKFQENKKRANA